MLPWNAQFCNCLNADFYCLESYPFLGTEEKNRLWKLVMKKATVYRSPDDKLTVNIYPNLPK